MEDNKRQFKAVIEEKMLKTGEKDRLKEHLRQRLVESGWKEKIKTICKETLSQRNAGIPPLISEQLTVDDLVQLISPRARSLVPEQVKAELLQKIRLYLKEME